MTDPQLSRMRKHLAEHHDLPSDLDEQTVRKTFANMMASGKLTPEKYLEIICPPEHNTTPGTSTNSTKEHSTMSDSKATPAQVFNRGGDPRIKPASEMYSEKRYEAKHPKTGNPVHWNGGTLTMPSEKENAFKGVLYLDIARRAGIPGVPEPTDHEMELRKELYNDQLWCGRYAGKEWGPTKLHEILGRKGTDLIGSSGNASGGDGLVPYFYDQDIYLYPLLYGELFGLVDVQELGTSNQVIRPRFSNVSATWSSSEGSAATITLQTTDSIVDKLTSNVYNVAFAITAGRDLLNDSPSNIGGTISTLFGRKLASELDRVIATGSNSNKEPLGLANTSGANTVNSVNNSAGPYELTDLEAMLSSLPKQYRQKSDPTVAWVMADSSWFRMRAMKTGLTGDQRRVLGYDYEGYTLFNRPVKIQNDISGSDLMLAVLGIYRLYRRMGLAIETNIQGQTLMLNNEMLWVGRARFAGQLQDGAALSLMTNAPLHSN